MKDQCVYCDKKTKCINFDDAPVCEWCLKNAIQDYEERIGDDLSIKEINKLYAAFNK